MIRLILHLIRFYQILLSPYIGWHCRFHPSCSAYAKEAFQTHGVLKGGWLTLRRILRCNPFGGSGVDEVPPPQG
jgi:putative membrane protein insertion efficiency factor